ncbi:F-box/RNI/FBD-like domain protein [Rhynchospora pubera]|nr:F-box/RNI/FBD-like domain protein [Rhynchospora pubera]
MILTTWMKTLSQKQISELSIEADTDQVLFTTSLMSSCFKLKVLVLSRCFVHFPQEFDGFRLLHTIDLRDCTIAPKGIAGLVSYCPLLEILKFKPKSFIDRDIKIHSPNLRELTIYGKFTQVSLLTPNLCKANFVIRQLEATSKIVGLRGNLIKFPIYINDISSSRAFCYFLEKDPPTLNYLSTMVMILAPLEYHHIYSACLLLRRNRTLQKLVVFLEPVDRLPFSSDYKLHDYKFPFLTEATIIPFASSEGVIELAEIILINAPLLGRLIVRGEMNDCEVSKLNKIDKLSTKAEIILSESCFCVDGKYEGCGCCMCNIVAW